MSDSELYIQLQRVCSCVFLFQAEDGIRDLVRSRGLGDVYKRQVGLYGVVFGAMGAGAAEPTLADEVLSLAAQSEGAVSYTHLTLPTSDLV
mgnify:CR=1 FL=1